MGKNKDFEQVESLAQFIDSGQVDEVLGIIKSGKEATVYLCTGGSLIEEDLVAAKVYRSLDVRTFRDDAAYRHGRTRGNARQERGVRLKTRTGRELRFAQWMTSEYDTLRMLANAGVDVPRPVTHGGQAVLMEYIRDGDGDPAPTLQQADLTHAQARDVYDRLMENIQLMLANDRVHGDLSPFNVLYGDRGRLAIIDFPQAIDPRFNANALSLLERDVDRICAWASRFGIETDAFGFARRIWGRFVRSEL